MHAKAEPHPRELSLVHDGQIIRLSPSLVTWTAGLERRVLHGASPHALQLPSPPSPSPPAPLPALSAVPFFFC